MALPEREILVQFAQGLETKKDRKGVLPSKMLALENAVFSKAISFVKRNGYEDLGAVVMGSVDPLPQPIALGRRGFELLAFTGTESYSFIDDASAWVKAGDIQSVICDHEAVAKTGSDQTLADMATLAGVALYAWEDSRGGVWYALLDDYTGRALVPPTQVDDGGERPRCHAVGAFLHLYWVRTAAQEIRVWRIEPADPTAAPTENILLTSINGAAPHYDVDTDDEKAVIAWHNTDGHVGVAYIHQQGAIGGAGLGLPVPIAISQQPGNCVAVAIDKTDADRRVAVAMGESDKKYIVLDSDLVQEFVLRTIEGNVAGDAQRMTVVFLEESSASGHRELWIVAECDEAGQDRVRALKVDNNPAGLTLLAERTQLGLVLGGKAFLDDGDAYVITQHDTTLYRTYFGQRVSDGLAVARFLPGLAGGKLTKPHLPSVGLELSPEGRAVCFAGIYVVDVESPGGDVFTEKGVRRVSLDFLSPDAFRSAQLGKTLYIAGGLVQAYDGVRITEAGFHVAPDDIPDPTTGSPATSGPAISEGVYGYVFVYEHVLANGEVERGPTSPLMLVEVPDDISFVELEIPTYRWPTKPGARIGVFRSLNGDSSVLSRVSSLDPTTAGQINGYVANDPDADTVSFRDEMDDATLERQDPLYTNGGIPPNDPLGAARLIAGGKNRLFVVDSSQPNRVYFSQELSDGFAAEFSPDLFIEVDPFGGDINGLIVMDDALIAFKETGVFGIGGAGPLALPEAGDGFTQPKLITSDVGCVSPDSVGYTPIGVCFQSQKGIYLLGRDFSVSYVGAAVEAFNRQRVVACTLIEDKTQIRFLTEAGKSLLYDYQATGPDGLGQWSTFTNHEGQDAILVDGSYFYLRNDGRVFLETESVYRDNNSQIRMAMETANLNLAGHMQGWQFLWWVTVIGEFKTDHQLRVFMAFDYEEGWSGPPIIIDPAEARVVSPYGAGAYGAGPYGGVNDTRYQFQIHVGQECEAVRFRFEDVEPTGEFGASFELSELHLTGGVQRSSYGVEEARVY
jgi:hypothetical protein